MGDQGGVHEESEDHPWTRRIPDHPPRTDSARYVRSRTAMNGFAEGISPFFYGDPDYEDHHGGGSRRTKRSSLATARRNGGLRVATDSRELGGVPSRDHVEVVVASGEPHRRRDGCARSSQCCEQRESVAAEGVEGAAGRRE